MENKKERVMAYNLAKTINKEELTEVSGGTVQVSTKQSVQATSDSARGIDTPYDTIIDW